MSRHGTSIPFYGVTRSVATARWMRLFQNVEPIVAQQWRSHEAVIQDVQQWLVARGVVKAGDLMVVTSGDPMAESGGTNSMRIIRVTEEEPLVRDTRVDWQR